MYAFSGKRIEALRNLHGLSQADFGRKINKERQQVAIWEGEINKPSIDNLLVISNAFDVDPSFFFVEVSTTVEERPIEASHDQVAP